MPLASGTRLGLYEIHAPIGAGGMGEVYRATDTRLGREVAVKILPAEMAHDPDRLARFHREARAVAALNHPNVVTLYSVEECDGVHFLTMELVEGMSLDRRISGGGMPVEQILEIAGALAEALAAAHEKGIMHRDLKPANVMVANDGRVKVLDFGLAKDVRLESSSDATLTSAQTQVGVVMGTPAYMSPEQVAGRALDHRTDIFSLGVMLHEMATGRRPFDGSSSAELASAILRDTPITVTDLRSDLPGDLARIIRRCLEKDPRHRVQTARDVSNEFRDLARQAPRAVVVPGSTSRAFATADSGSARSEEAFRVAVLPFKYKGSDAGLQALAEGFTEETITGLSRFSYLKVISHSSSERYAQAADAGSAARELGARYVMEGSIRQAGAKLRIAVQLVDATTGSHLWAETYERAFSPDAIFELQDDLVPRMVSTIADMNGVLPRSMSDAVREKTPEQLTPYEAVLRSFGYFERVTAEDLGAARLGLERAVEKSPTYADAWAMLALLCVQDYVQGFRLRPDSMAAGEAAARRAVAVGASNHLAYFSLAQVIFFQKDFQSFRNTAERAVALNPMDGNTIAFLGELMTYAGIAERGMELAGRAKQLNPNHPGWYWFADFYHAYSKGDDRAALGYALKSSLMGHYGTHMMVAAAYGQLGETKAAAKALQELLTLRPDVPGVFRSNAANWWNPEYCARLLEGLVKAGMVIPQEDGNGPAVPALASFQSRAKEDSGAARSAVRDDEGFWVAVLPFKSAGASSEIKAVADGLSEEIVAGLSRFSYLRVITQSSTQCYADQSPDLRAVGKELGASYVMTGNLRQVGARLRVSAQLIHTFTGAQLWAETYERPFSAEAAFELQDDLAARIAATVGDAHGILAHTMSEALRSKSPDELTPYEAVLRSFGYGYRQTPEEHATVRDALELAVQKAPGYADAWGMLALVYADEFAHAINLQPDSLGRALQAARRAVDAAPSSATAHSTLARVMFFRKEFQAFRTAAEQAIALNPLNSPTLAGLGAMMAYSGDWERGCALAERAMQLNPRHPGWYWIPLYCNAYRKGDYRDAVNLAIKFNLPGFYVMHEALAAAYGQLGEHEAASQALREVLRLKPDYATAGRERLEKWFDPEFVEHLMEGLRKAGSNIGSETTTAHVTTDSGAARARVEEGFWVAVLPFKYSGANADLTALAEGLTEDIITGMSRFPYLRVIAKSSTARHAREPGEVRVIGKELGARYVIEGNLRQAGTTLRIAVQLVDTVSGAHRWAETYERAFTPEAVFKIQDDLVPRIVSTIADAHGMLPHSMSEAIRDKAPEQLTPYEAVLRSFIYSERITPEDHAAARTALEHAVQLNPGYAYAWAMLSILYADEYAQGFGGLPEPLERALMAARKAVDLESSNHRAFHALAVVQFHRREIRAFRTAAERTITLNPMDGCSLAHMGTLMAYAGDWERGCALVQQSVGLNPHHPGWYWFPLFFRAYRQGDYRGALSYALKINLPLFPSTHMVLAAAYGQLGELDAAGKAVRELLTFVPSFAAIARPALAVQFWFDPELAEQVLDGLRKAGLKIPDKPETAGTALKS